MRVDFHENSRIEALIALATWKSDAVHPTREPIGGTNTSYFVEYKGVEYVLRIAAPDSDILTINRKAEHQALRIASSIGIGARLMCFNETNGDMITLVQAGRMPSAHEVRQPENFTKVAATLRALHHCKVDFEFNPGMDVATRIRYIESNGPDLLQSELYRKAKAAYDATMADPLPGINEARFRGLCHNDPCVNNMILRDRVALIDYEFAGMGNIFFDIASVCGLWDEGLQRNFLQSYFGAFDRRYASYTRAFTITQLFWNAAWGYVRTCSDKSGMIDYKSWANEQLSLAVAL